MTLPFLFLGPDPDIDRRFLLQCPVCEQTRSVAYTTYYCWSKPRQTSVCGRCSRARFDENTSDFILIGVDPERLGYWLVRCPDCSNVRSLSATSKHRRVKAGTTRCASCAAIRLRDPRQHNTDVLIVVAPTDGSRQRWTVQCPECLGLRELGRGELSRLRKNGHSLCRSCASLGARHHRWIDNPDQQRRYQRVGWYRTRARILARDGHKCQFPGCNRTHSTDGKHLSVHHIDPLRNCDVHDDDNLISLCSEHHTWADHHLETSIPSPLGLANQSAS